MNMILPNVIFSPWFHWDERSHMSNINQPGVYLLAHFETPDPGNANPQAKEIIYIGETCTRLSKRWRQFHRSAFEGKWGHSGGRSYWKTFGKEDRHRLYVASLPIDDVAFEQRALFIRYIERKLILEYALRWGFPPILNKK